MLRRAWAKRQRGGEGLRRRPGGGRWAGGRGRAAGGGRKGGIACAGLASLSAYRVAAFILSAWRM